MSLIPTGRQLKSCEPLMARLASLMVWIDCGAWCLTLGTTHILPSRGCCLDRTPNDGATEIFGRLTSSIFQTSFPFPFQGVKVQGLESFPVVLSDWQKRYNWRSSFVPPQSLECHLSSLSMSTIASWPFVTLSEIRGLTALQNLLLSFISFLLQLFRYASFSHCVTRLRCFL